MAKSDRTAPVPVGRRSRVQIVGLAILVLIAAVACSDDRAAPSTTTSEVDRPPPPTTPSTTTTPPTTAARPAEETTTPSGDDRSTEEEIIARYIAYWDARFAANSGTPNPDHPALAEHATGAQLEAVIAETRANLAQGLVFEERSDPTEFRTVDVIEVDTDFAVVQECFVDDGLVVRRDTGEVVNDTIATHNVRSEMRRVDGSWRVSEARLIQRWEGVAGCANVG